MLEQWRGNLCSGLSNVYTLQVTIGLGASATLLPASITGSGGDWTAYLYTHI